MPANALNSIQLSQTLSKGAARDAVRRQALRALGFLLRPLSQAPAPSALSPQPSALAQVDRPRIVVLRPDHLGDVLLSRPALQALREGLPTAEVTLAVGPWGAPSTQGLAIRVVAFPFPGFTRDPKGHPLAPYRALLAFAARLRRERFQAAVILRPDHWWGALACAFAGVPIRVGHASPEMAPFLTHPVALAGPEHCSVGALRDVEELLHALGASGLGQGQEERGRQLAAASPAAGGPAAPEPRFVPSREARQRARAWLTSHGLQAHPLVALHPGAGAPVKLWPAHRWTQVVQALQAGGVSVLLTVGADDEPRVLVAPALPAAVDMDWDTLGGLYAQVDLVVGMDSGPLHLAQAVGTPTVRLYGPTDPRIHGPGGDPLQHPALQGLVPCAPCGNLIAPPCGYRRDPPCLAAVGVKEVVRAIQVQLRRQDRLPLGEPGPAGDLYFPGPARGAT